MTEDGEIWLPVPSLEGLCEISSSGRVRNPDGKILSPYGCRYTVQKDGARTRFNIKPVYQQVFGKPMNSIENLEGEIWKPIPKYEDFYEISNKCRVRSFPRKISDGRFREGRLLKIWDSGHGLVVHLCPNDRKNISFRVEKAVIKLFPETIKPVDCLDGEEWRDVVGYEGLYRISNLGRVLSLDRIVKHSGGRTRYVRQRLLRHGMFSAGYPKAELAKEGSVDTISIHVLVAKAFIPNPNGYDTVHHIDENKLNYSVDNLEWVTRAKNVQDWFDRRRVVVSTDTIDRIASQLADGKTASEILAALPRRRKSQI